MTLEVLANNLKTTLSSSINTSQSTIHVASTSGFPASGQFRVVVESVFGNGTGEIMLCASWTGTTLTVLRNAEPNPGAGSNPQAFGSGAAVSVQLTGAGLGKFALQNPYMFRAHMAAAPFLVSGSTAILPIDTVDFDPNSGWSAANHWWVCPVAGYYRVSGQYEAASGAPGSCQALIYKNGAYYSGGGTGFSTTSILIASAVADLVLCAVGDTIALWVYNILCGDGNTGTGQYNYLAIELVAAT